jgi:hypothetical protein
VPDAERYGDCDGHGDRHVHGDDIAPGIVEQLAATDRAADLPAVTAVRRARAG